MRLFRTILALLIALSVATLPTAGSTALMAKSADTSMSDMMSMDDCEHAAMPCHKAGDCCGSMANCTLTSFIFLQSNAATIRFQRVAADRPFVSAEAPVRLQSASPPFRPPWA